MCFPLYAASRLMVNAYRPLLEPLGLTYPQYLVMLVLWEKDGMSVGDIGARLHLDSGTLTGLLKRLAQQGLIVRKRSLEDDRVVVNWLTDAGRTLKRRAMPVPTEMLCRAGLGLNDVDRAKTMLDDLIARLLPLQRGEASGDD